MDNPIRFSPLQFALRQAYYSAMWPVRRSLTQILARQQRMPQCVLFYHRVADTCPSPWTISRAEFQWQIQWLVKHREVVSLAEIQRRIRLGSSRSAVAITFDDGYAENCEFALPLLIRLRVPCTYFVSVSQVLRGEAFPHDAALGEMSWPNTVEQLQALSAAGIEIGTHGRSHTDLGRIGDVAALHDEITVATRELEQAIQQRIRYFAFPYGFRPNMPDAAWRLLRDHGFQAACSAYGDYNLVGQDGFHLRRIHADPQRIRFQNWLSLDPRKLLARSRQEDYPCAAPAGTGPPEGARSTDGIEESPVADEGVLVS